MIEDENNKQMRPQQILVTNRVGLLQCFILLTFLEHILNVEKILLLLLLLLLTSVNSELK